MFEWLCCVVRDKKDLKARQAKMSMETCKQVMSDKTIKNKAERDRFVSSPCHQGLQWLFQSSKFTHPELYSHYNLQFHL